MRTRAVPVRTIPMRRAAALERSRMRLPWNGPRSLTRTTTLRPLRTLVTRSRVPKGNRRWAAVKASGLNRAPLAVRRPRKRSP